MTVFRIHSSTSLGLIFLPSIFRFEFWMIACYWCRSKSRVFVSIYFIWFFRTVSHRELIAIACRPFIEYDPSEACRTVGIQTPYADRHSPTQIRTMVLIALFQRPWSFRSFWFFFFHLSTMFNSHCNANGLFFK